MTFTVTYRGADGAPVTETVEAADRADCLAQLKARGIAAMGVKEGGGRDGAHASSAGQARPSTRNSQPSTLNSPPSTRTRRKPIVPYVVLVAFVALVAGGIWWWLGRDEARPSQDDDVPKKTALAKVVKPAAAPKPIELPAKPTNRVETVVLPDGTVTNKPKTIAEAVAMVRLKPGFHRYNSVDEVFSKTNDFQIGEYKQPLFKTHVESHLGLVAAMPRDQTVPPMPPLPPNLENDFEKALATLIEIGDDDSEADARTKMRVAEMKAKMQTLVKDEGFTVSQAFREIEREHNRLANMTMLYKGAYRKMVLSGDKGAAAFLKQANEELRSSGACEFDENANTINP